MTADTAGACYSFVQDYTPTYGCQVYTGYNYEYGPSTVTYVDYTDSDVTRTTVVEAPTETISRVTTDTTRLDPDQTRYSGLIAVPVITLLYHEEDLVAATGAAEADSVSASEYGDEGESESASGTPSNAAGRLGASGSSVWNGFGSVVGIWIGAAALGAAMVLPW
jgi:hypothetical protein